jgi:phospholipase/carboxylesterase
MMNRLTALAPAKGAASAKLRERTPVRPAPRPDLPLCLLAPLHYERNYAYPLVVWLHDTGGNERELKRIMPLVSLRNYVSLAVRGTCEAGDGFCWGESPDGLLAAEARVADAVAQARQRFNIHRERIFLAGHGAGGTMALRLALRSPENYAGAASIGGCFPQGHSPLARLALARRSRLLIMHCRDSEVYSVQRVCDELALFHSAGLSVTLRQYPCGDELTTQMLRDLDVWLMEQVTGVNSATQQEPAQQPSEWN